VLARVAAFVGVDVVHLGSKELCTLVELTNYVIQPGSFQTKFRQCPSPAGDEHVLQLIRNNPRLQQAIGQAVKRLEDYSLPEFSLLENGDVMDNDSVLKLLQASVLLMDRYIVEGSPPKLTATHHTLTQDKVEVAEQ
jgi:hypothetical protein